MVMPYLRMFTFQVNLTSADVSKWRTCAGNLGNLANKCNPACVFHDPVNVAKFNYIVHVRTCSEWSHHLRCRSTWVRQALAVKILDRGWSGRGERPENCL